MCGLNGFFNVKSAISAITAIERMNAAIVHRGPDAEGVWFDDKIGLALGHRRLAVQDLSSAGAQPMHSSDGRYVLVFNGEIYNHHSLRKHLSGQGFACSWRGGSDTETLLACFEVWGIEKTLRASVGMFAFALWDKTQCTLTLARDRLGEKPIYWGWQQQELYFSSELKGIKAHPSFKPEVDRDSLTLLLRHNCIPAPYSIYKNVEKLRPGHWIQLPLGDPTRAMAVRPQAYWSLNSVVQSGRTDPFEGSEEEAITTLEQTLMESVDRQMLSDVPLGAFLSGGIDSSTIVSLMQAHARFPVKTYTIGFDNTGYDEATHAKAVAAHLGTEHTELYVRPEDALAVIPSLPSLYCEPFSDSSQIPTFLISQLASQNVTVALSGDGGDELFGGYNRYLMACRVWQKSRLLPRSLRLMVAAALTALPPKQWDTLFAKVNSFLPTSMRLRTPGDKAHKLAGVLGVDTEQAFYRYLTSHWLAPEKIVIGAREPETMINNYDFWPEVDSFDQAMMVMDAQTYMPDDILVKVDRAAMANSLETRVPMLDPGVVEFAWKIPQSYKIRYGEGKWLLKQVLFRHVPQDLVERPKMGFGIPLHDWLRGPLRDWAEALLDERRLKNEGFFHPGPVRQMWQAHLSGKRNHQHSLWDVLMFQAWLESQ